MKGTLKSLKSHRYSTASRSVGNCVERRNIFSKHSSMLIYKLNFTWVPISEDPCRDPKRSIPQPNSRVFLEIPPHRACVSVQYPCLLPLELAFQSPHFFYLDPLLYIDSILVEISCCLRVKKPAVSFFYLILPVAILLQDLYRLKSNSQLMIMQDKDMTLIQMQE